MATHRQPSFAAGELAPTLWGRVDLDRYAAGARAVENFWVSKHGALVSRPGTTFCADLGPASDPVPRLAPFLVSDGEHRLVVFRPNLVDIFKGGSRITGLGAPFTAADLPKLRFVQSGDVMTITSGRLAVLELIRSPGDPDTWSYGTLPTPAPYAARRPVLYSPRSDTFGKDRDGARAWRWWVTVVERQPDGTLRESRPREVTSYFRFLGSGPNTWHVGLSDELAHDGWAIVDRDHPVVCDVRTMRNPAQGAADVVSTRLYRGRDGIAGLVAEVYGPQTLSAEHDVIDPALALCDFGDEPDYTRQPPKITDPFAVLLPGGATRYESPRAIAYFDARLVLGGTSERPMALWASAVDDFGNFDTFIPPKASDAAELHLAGRRREEIRWLLGLETLLVGTSGGIWQVAGFAGDQPGEARLQTEVGASALEPLVVGSDVLYVADRGSRVVALAYSTERRGYGVRDLTILASHLVDGHRIVSWAHAPEPAGLVWCVRDDGVLLSLTYEPDHGVVAWARHTTAGAVLAVATVPEGDEDAVYLVVKRSVGGESRYLLERLASRRVGELKEFVGLDSARQRTVVLVGQQDLALGGFEHLEGTTPRALVNGVVVDATGPVEGGVARFPGQPGMLRVAVGLPYTCRLETLDLPAGKDRPKIVQKTVWEVEASRGMWTGAGAGLWAGDAKTPLTEWRQRVVADEYSAMALHTGDVEVRIASRYGEHGRVVLEQRDPLPLTVLGLTREGQ